MQGRREQISPPSGHSFRVLRWSHSVQEVTSLLAADQFEPIVGEGDHWHYHVEMELTLFAEGSGTRFVGDHIGNFGAGDLVLLGEKLPHYWHAKGPSAGLAVQWSFPPGHPFWNFPESGAFVDFFRKAGRGILYKGLSALTIRARLQELVRQDGLGRLGLLMQLLEVMAKAPAAETAFLSSRSFSLSTESLHQQAMGEAVRYLLANFRDEVRLEDLLRITGMSKPTFSRQFKKHSGKSFSDFISHVRLQAACRELVETDHSVLEIALSSGFTQLSFFNRIFRSILGTSPSQYRMRERKDLAPQALE